MGARQLGDLFGGRYRLLRRLGAGGMGQVYLAQAEGPAGFEKLFAVKIAFEHMTDEPASREMFLEEARVSASLTHANIGQIFDLGISDGTYYIAMEYVPGKDLRSLQHELKTRGLTMPPELAAYVVCRLCEGLDFAHRARDNRGRPLKLVHRDISPSNCLVSVNGEVKLIDFGIAKAATQDRQTEAGVIKGKVGYVSPEQVRGQVYDRRSDLFSLGVVFYELLTGRRPFDAPTDLETLKNIRDAKPTPPRKISPEVPAALEAVVLKALKRDPQDRYQWASELQEDVESWLRSSGAAVGAKQLAALMHETFGQDVLYATASSPGEVTGATREVPGSPRQGLRTQSGPREAPTTPARVDAVSRLGTRGAQTPLPPPEERRSRTRAWMIAVALALVIIGGAAAIVVGRNADAPEPLDPKKSSTLPGAGKCSAEPGQPLGLECAPGTDPHAVASATAPVPAFPPPPSTATPTATKIEPPTAEPPDPFPHPVATTAPPTSASATVPRVTTSKGSVKPPRAKPAEGGDAKATASRVPPPAAEGAVAYVTVRSNVAAEVVIDGKTVGQTPQIAVEVSAGKHTVRVDCLYAWGKQEGRPRVMDIPPEAEATVRHVCEEVGPPAPQ